MGFSPLAHTSFLSSLFGVGVQRALGALVYRRPKEGCRPIGVGGAKLALIDVFYVLGHFTSDCFRGVVGMHQHCHRRVVGCGWTCDFLSTCESDSSGHRIW